MADFGLAVPVVSRYLGNNGLMGTIPDAVGDLTALQYL